MPSLRITVKVDAGTAIEVAAKEAVELARKIGVVVHFTFNEVECVAEPNGDSEALARRYYEVSTSGSPFRFAFSR